MKEQVFMEVKESVSPYGEMMELLKEYIDKMDTITYCDSLPDTGEADHLYIVRTGEAYIYDGEWIELTGGGGTSGITGISVNGTPQEVIDHVVDLLIPEKTSELDNDSGYITDESLEGYAKTEDIPTELSDLKNDMGYITEDALDGYALEDEIPTKTSQLENDSDYTTTEAVKSEIAEQIAEIVAGAPESLDTLKEIADWIEHHEDDAAAMNTAIKEAQETADSALTEAEAVKDSIPTKVSELDNDAGYVDSDALDEVKQTADDKVNSVKVGTVTTGDEPSATNSGTDKDVTLDFVFPSGGGGGELSVYKATFNEGRSIASGGYVALTFDIDLSDYGTPLMPQVVSLDGAALLTEIMSLTETSIRIGFLNPTTSAEYLETVVIWILCVK